MGKDFNDRKSSYVPMDLDSGMACVSELKRIGMPVPDASVEVSSITTVSVHPAAKVRIDRNRICPKFCFIKRYVRTGMP